MPPVDSAQDMRGEYLKGLRDVGITVEKHHHEVAPSHHELGMLDNTLVNQYIKVNDENSFNTARALIKKEGLLIGGSSGTAMYAAIQAAKNLDSKQNCLVILPDSIRNYLSKFADDDWMKKNNFKEK